MGPSVSLVLVHLGVLSLLLIWFYDNQLVARHFISLIIVSNIWQYAAFPFIKEARKAAKL